MSTVIRGARIVVGDGEPTPADLLLYEGRIRAVGVVEAPEGSEVIDADGRIAVPGLVDTHSHADAAVFREDVQLALLRQGVTSIVAGQDGVSFAPGDGAWAGEYFGAINGRHPTYRGGGIAALLSTYDGTTPINVAYLNSAGTVRHEVMGDDDRAPDAGELTRMVELVRTGMREGAVGLSSGLDYVPGIFASAEELAALCAPVAKAGGVYVTHMRGGYEDNSRAGIEEAERICRASGVGLHVSHFHARADEVERLMARLSDAGVTATFDMYPYTRGNSLLATLLLPPWLNRLGGEQAAAELADERVRARLRQEWIPTVAAHPSLGAAWPEMITVSHIAAEELAWAHGRTLGHIARERGTDAASAAFDLLQAARLEVAVVMAVRDERPVTDLGKLFTLPGHLGGSDGIFIGAHPHPRGYGTFASYLADYTVRHRYYTWAAAIDHLSTGAVRRFGLGARGTLSLGAMADVVLVDEDRVAARADYADPTRLAEGIDDVWVAGRPVLRDGRLTGERPGQGLRRSTRPTTPTQRKHDP